MRTAAFVVAALRTKRNWAGFAAAVAAAQACAFAALGQSSDTLRVRSIGEPPKEVIDFVAEQARRMPLTLEAGATLGKEITRRCGYEGEVAQLAYLAKVAEFNKARLPAQPKLEAALETPLELEMPACIVARRREVDVRNNAGIGQLIKAELGLDYDPVDRKWGSFVEQFCTLNKDKVSCTNKANPVLPKDRVMLPAIPSVSEFHVPNSAIQATELRNVLTAATKAGGGAKQLFEWKEVEVVRPVVVSMAKPPACQQPNSPVTLPLGSRNEPVDWSMFLKLANEYAAHQRRLKADQPPTVITVIDTGADDSRPSIQSRLYHVDGIPDSSQAQISNPGTPYKTGEYRPVEAKLIIDPDVLPPEHGTEVASIALGETSLAAISAGGAPLPGVRFFRALRKNEDNGLYLLDERSFERAFKFLSDRLPVRKVPGKPDVSELSIINISLATQFSNSVTSVENNLSQLRDVALVIAAAGNDGATIAALGDQNGTALVFPAAFGGKHPRTGAFVVSVGASRSDGRGRTEGAKGSNVSNEFVDLFSWGECEGVFGIGGQPAIRGGTSVAAPWVTLTASFLLQGPLFFDHPASVKTRIVSAVRSSPAFFDVSESGGLLDPIRTIDVMVDHLIVDEGNGPERIRGLVDYKASSSPCAQVPRLGNLARFERRDNNDHKKLWFRSRNYFTQPKFNQGVPERRDLLFCANPSLGKDKLVSIIPDKDFERLAKGETVVPRKIAMEHIQEYVARLNENAELDVSMLPRNNDTRCIYLRTAAIANNGPMPEACPAPSQ